MGHHHFQSVKLGETFALTMMWKDGTTELLTRVKNMSFYVLLPLLHNESALLIAQMKLLSNGKLTRKTNSKTRSVNNKVNKYCLEKIVSSTTVKVMQQSLHTQTMNEHIILITSTYCIINYCNI